MLPNISDDNDNNNNNNNNNKVMIADYKGIKNNTNFGQITGIQEKLDITCK